MPRVKSDEEYHMMKNEMEATEKEAEAIHFREDPVEAEELERGYQMGRSLFRGIDSGDEYFKGIKRRNKKDTESPNLDSARRNAEDKDRNSGIDVDLELRAVEQPQIAETSLENVEKSVEVNSEGSGESKQAKIKEKKVLYVDDINNLAEFFKIYSDSTRLKIIYLLSLKEIAVSDIAEALDITQSATSHQLKILRTHRLVKARKVAKQVFYSLDDHHIVEILNAGISHINEQ